LSDGAFAAVINGGGYNFKLQLKEKWKQENGVTIMIGVGINGAPWGWTERHYVTNSRIELYCERNASAAVLGFVPLPNLPLISVRSSVVGWVEHSETQQS